ncbi:MAG: hypothetical protein KC464_21280 [Myxococcales bacterium]|nr:hypothetical protein [Myxococcales bacterium]
MRFHLATLLATLALPLAACGDDGGSGNLDAGADASIPDGGPPDCGCTGDGRIDVTWNVVDGGVGTTCPAGASAAIYALRDGDATPYVDLYDCVDGAGSAADLPLGDYLVWVEIGDGTTVAGRSPGTGVVLNDSASPATVDVTVELGGGYFGVSWTLAGTTCAAVTQDGVSILSTLSGTTDAYDDIWNCADGEAPAHVTTAELPLGDYVVVGSVIDSNGGSLGDAPAVESTISYGDQVVDLGTLTITLF